MQGHLAAFKPHFFVTARARMLSLVATAGSFSESGSNATAYTLFGVLGAHSWFQIIQFH
jgi:hypothetical protein